MAPIQTPSVKRTDPLMRELAQLARMHPYLFTLNGKQILDFLETQYTAMFSRLEAAYSLHLSIRRFGHTWSNLRLAELKKRAKIVPSESRKPAKIVQSRSAIQRVLAQQQEVRSLAAQQNRNPELQRDAAITRIKQQELSYLCNLVYNQQGRALPCFPLPQAQELPKPNQQRKVVGRSILYVVLEDYQIIKLELRDRTSVDQVKAKYGGMRAAFIMNPNIKTTKRDYIAPEGTAPLLVVMHKKLYRIGVLKSFGLMTMELLLWKSDPSDLFQHKRWHHPESWETISLASNQKVLDGAYVNQFYSTEGFVGKDWEPKPPKPYIQISGGPDFCQMPNFQKSLVIYCEVPAKPKDRKQKLRSVCTAEKHFVSVPLGVIEEMDSSKSFHYREFVNVSRPKLRNICQNDFSNEKEFQSAIRQSTNVKPFPMLVPSLQVPTRIVAVDPSDFAKLKKQKDQNIHFNDGKKSKHPLILREEFGPPDDKDSIGVCIASIDLDATLNDTTQDITFESATTFPSALSRAGQTRSCAEHEGFAAYRGAERGTDQPNPTPGVADEEVRNQSFHDANKHRNQLSLFPIESRLQELSGNAIKFGKKLLPALFSIPEEEQCDRNLVTIGHRWSKEYLFAFLGFVNGIHIDVNDFIDEELFEKIADASEYGPQLRKMRKLVGFGTATTCQYKHLWNDGADRNAYEVNAFFMHHGVGVAHPLLDQSGFSFLGFASKHSTSFCYLVDRKTKLTILQNRENRDIFMMFAWGKGGKSGRRRVRFQQLGGTLPERLTQATMDNWINNNLHPTHQAIWDGLSQEQQDNFRTGEAMNPEPQFPQQGLLVLDLQAAPVQDNETVPAVAGL